MKVMVKEHVEAEVVRKVFGGDHQSKRSTAENVVSPSDAFLARISLFGPQIEIESKQHKEDQKRVLFTDAIYGDGVHAHSPERSREQSGPTIKERCGEQK